MHDAKQSIGVEQPGHSLRKIERSFLNRAELEAREALQLRPTLADVHRVLAGVLYQKGRFRDALEEQTRAVELGGPEENVVGFIGMTLDTLGKLSPFCR